MLITYRVTTLYLQLFQWYYFEAVLLSVVSVLISSAVLKQTNKNNLLRSAELIHFSSYALKLRPSKKNVDNILDDDTLTPVVPMVLS